ncbi:hypothetical protein GOB57_07910 [Sinorhizobium meliloti]|nr:hypothetical protein [Sinorhizobium meliloti]
MLVEEFMQNFVTQFHAVEEALEEARQELNETDLPHGVGQLRLSIFEIKNIVLNAGGFTNDPGAESPSAKENERLIMEGLNELSEQLYLAQYPNTLSEVLGDFRRDLVTLIRLNPTLMRSLTPIIRQFKVKAASRLSTSKKFETLLAMTEECIDALPDDIPDYALRVLDEVADFSTCMTLVTDNIERETPTAANDNVAVA